MRSGFRPYEAQARSQGYGVLAGVDEAGRGCLAGPVVAAAVVLPPDLELAGVADSKLLSEDRREAAFDRIRSVALASAVGIAEVHEIDALNILVATHLAMRRALEGLTTPPDLILVDGNMPIPGFRSQRTLVKGDRFCLSIAAASILAKVTRDRLMVSLSRLLPQYELDIHKGYPTERHRQLLLEHGPSLHHRRTFRGVRELLEAARGPGPSSDDQLGLWSARPGRNAESVPEPEPES